MGSGCRAENGRGMMGLGRAHQRLVSLYWYGVEMAHGCEEAAGSTRVVMVERGPARRWNRWSFMCPWLPHIAITNVSSVAGEESTDPRSQRGSDCHGRGLNWSVGVVWSAGVVGVSLQQARLANSRRGAGSQLQDPANRDTSESVGKPATAEGLRISSRRRYRI